MTIVQAAPVNAALRYASLSDLLADGFTVTDGVGEVARTWETDKVVLPQEDGSTETLEASELDPSCTIGAAPQIAQSGTKAKRRKTERKPIRLPAPRVGSDYGRTLYRFGQRWGLRHLGDQQRAGEPVTDDAGTLADEILCQIMKRAGHRLDGWDVHRARHRPHVAQAERAARDAAVFVLDTWSPAYLARQARRGAAGGRKSRRVPTVSIERLRATAGLSRADAAAFLGVTERTVTRLWSRYGRDS